jgi:non-canonical purine NTP pyrophosphatase (RdgB/HAM1 family)
MAKDFVFISGNQHKVEYLELWLGRKVEHHKVDLDEIQDLDIRKVSEHKARQAYEILKRPVLVEDVALTFTAMGKLPGTLIKWFLQELGSDGLCRLANSLEHQQTVASICYTYFDGQEAVFFENHVPGRAAEVPRGEYGFGWNPVFIPDGTDKTYAEMTGEEVRPFSVRAQIIEPLKVFLDS